MSMGFIIVGFLAGVISGMGIGGGVLLIPALGLFFGMSQHAAQSINLLYFLPTAAIAIITHKKKGNIQRDGMLKLTLFGLVGAGVGASLALWMNPAILRKVFGGFLFIMGMIEIFKKGNDANNEKDDKHGTNGIRGNEAAV